MWPCAHSTGSRTSSTASPSGSGSGRSVTRVAGMSGCTRAFSLQEAGHPPVGQWLAAGLAPRTVLQAGVGEADLPHHVPADRALLAGATVHRQVGLLLALELARG